MDAAIVPALHSSLRGFVNALTHKDSCKHISWINRFLSMACKTMLKLLMKIVATWSTIWEIKNEIGNSNHQTI
ncbi:MAG: hypothetical protein DHS20C09_13880 [marine bacterium B5-7]|nr:MAG: hypothetical protein DHS20C09_13880 [marine bacterium B5-7]